MRMFIHLDMLHSTYTLYGIYIQFITNGFKRFVKIYKFHKKIRKTDITCKHCNEMRSFSRTLKGLWVSLVQNMSDPFLYFWFKQHLIEDKRRCEYNEIVVWGWLQRQHGPLSCAREDGPYIIEIHRGTLKENCCARGVHTNPQFLLEIKMLLRWSSTKGPLSHTELPAAKGNGHGTGSLYWCFKRSSLRTFIV